MAVKKNFSSQAVFEVAPDGLAPLMRGAGGPCPLLVVDLGRTVAKIEALLALGEDR